ncbi:MAG: inorganic phosphate transporter, partial [Pantoea sp.]|nr:inorganic phosphate transporter [Pantoea sp.]
MSENQTWHAASASASARPNLSSKHSKKTAFAVITLIAAGLVFAGVNLLADVEESGQVVTSYFPFVLLGL